MTDHIVDINKKVQSSDAAEAAWEAFNEDEAGVFVDYGDKLAAAFRAVAHHLQRCSPWSDDDPGSIPVNWCTSELHAIATELESQ